jgi:peptidyl-prolyl cis-trans isomerase B (cyclophilin B)
MKKLVSILGVSAIAILLFAFCAKPSADQQKEQPQKSEIKKEEKMETTTSKTNPQYIITVTQKGEKMGDIVLELFPDVAPKHCHNFDSLVAIKFFDGTAFHRVIPGFMIQGGDPNSKNKPKSTWGGGDPSQTTVPAEFSKLHHERGTLSAARTPDPNSATSQFFICVTSVPHLDGQYSIYGKVLTGMEVVDKVVNAPRDSKDNPNDKIEMKIVKK